MKFLLSRYLCLLVHIAFAAQTSSQSHALRSRQLQTSPSDGRPILDGHYKSVTLDTGAGGCSGSQEAILDIYRSDDASAPTVLHLPGGAYMNLIGDTVESAGAQYINAGYTVAVLYYRLPRSPTTTNWLVCSDPWEAIDDLAAAMQLLQTNAAEYHVDPDQIVLSGFSAGGHLASLYSSLCDARASCPRAQVLHFPFLEKGAQIFCSDIGSAFSNLEEFYECYPTELADAAMPPTVLYHASGDTLVPTAQMTDFISAIEEQSTGYEYYEVPGGGHFLVPFSQVAAISEELLDESDDYSSLIDRALGLSIPDCVRCDDKPTTWMINNSKDCFTADWHITNKCVDDPAWVSAGYCRSSCFDAGRGYPGETCCLISDEPACTECSNNPTPW
eukprot:CAMPEP_0178914700 /NCGR_PEP_ID=MMETSP0786-20121207/11585_1 /TAXON_ID=186022 /ORGANISM="Thalassionema frauenfeldii, Strain CCMP 1798" /LENGTH=387 /DNA_ID=CAMNT_0020587665 /DNA_START=195 /DNA_END=1355 /DNA_ORIENTATION=+